MNDKIGLFLAGTLIGLTLGLLINTRTMKYQSLEGYRGVALYETNSIREVKIKTIEWKKP